MSKFLERFRSTDTRKFTAALGVTGTLTDNSGRGYTVTGIDRDPYQSSIPLDQSFQNDSPAVWFITADLPETGIRGMTWTVPGLDPREIRSAEPNPRTGMTKATLTDQ